MSDLREKNLRQYSGFRVTPTDWTERTVAEICHLGRGRVISQDEIRESPGPYPVYSSQTRDNGTMGTIDSFDFDGEFVTWTTDGENAGTVFYRSGRFNCTNVCGTLQSRVPNQIDLRFLTYHLGRVAKKYVSYVGNPKLMNGIMGSVGLAIPPISSQRRIAEILSTLDEAIERTEGLIGKLQQIKAGLMHDLFTRGVTPAGHLRPPRDQAPHLYKHSPLGWIPNEWEVKNLGALAEIVSGVTLGSKAEVTDEVGVPYLRVANVQDGYFDLADVKTIRVSRAQFEKLQLRFGDVLMNEGGDFDKLGRGSVWEEEIKPCIHQNHVFRVRPRDGRLRSYYLAFWSQSEAGKKYFVLSSKQSTNLASINSTQLNRFPIALPTATEQERIETRIFAMNDRADSLTNELAKLRQQKHGLMHDLLTGRVRVPVAAATEGGSA